MGCFPIQSSKGHKYIVIYFVANYIAILSEPIKNRAVHKLLQAYQKFYTILAKAEYVPQLHKLKI